MVGKSPKPRPLPAKKWQERALFEFIPQEEKLVIILPMRGGEDLQVTVPPPVVREMLLEARAQILDEVSSTFSLDIQNVRGKLTDPDFQTAVKEFLEKATK